MKIPQYWWNLDRDRDGYWNRDSLDENSVHFNWDSKAFDEKFHNSDRISEISPNN